MATSFDPSSQGGTAQQGVPMVTVSHGTGGAYQGSTFIPSEPRRVPITQLYDVIDRAFYAPDKSEYEGYRAAMSQALGRPIKTLAQAQGAWKMILQGAAFNPQYTPIEYLQVAAQTKALSSAFSSGSGAGAYNGPTSQTTLTSAPDAKTIVNQALTQYLGREATPDELVAFHKQLNSVEAANPRVSTPNGKHSSTLTGGVGSATQVAQDFATSRDDYAETTADTTLMSWFDNAIKTMQNDRIVQ